MSKRKTLEAKSDSRDLVIDEYSIHCSELLDEICHHSTAIFPSFPMLFLIQLANLQKKWSDLVRMFLHQRGYKDEEWHLDFSTIEEVLRHNERDICLPLSLPFQRKGAKRIRCHVLDRRNSTTQFIKDEFMHLFCLREQIFIAFERDDWKLLNSLNIQEPPWFSYPNAESPFVVWIYVLRYVLKTPENTFLPVRRLPRAILEKIDDLNPGGERCVIGLTSHITARDALRDYLFVEPFTIEHFRDSSFPKHQIYVHHIDFVHILKRRYLHFEGTQDQLYEELREIRDKNLAPFELSGMFFFSLFETALKFGFQPLFLSALLKSALESKIRPNPKFEKVIRLRCYYDLREVILNIENVECWKISNLLGYLSYLNGTPERQEIFPKDTAWRLFFDSEQNLTKIITLMYLARAWNAIRPQYGGKENGRMRAFTRAMRSFYHCYSTYFTVNRKISIKDLESLTVGIFPHNVFNQVLYDSAEKFLQSTQPWPPLQSLP